MKKWKCRKCGGEKFHVFTTDNSRSDGIITVVYIECANCANAEIDFRR